MKDKSKLILLLDNKNPWNSSKNKIWLSSSVTFFRNLEKFNFPGKLETERQKTVVNLVSEELLKYKGLNDLTLFRGEQLDPLEKEFLTEHFLSTDNFHHVHAGEAFVVDNAGEFVATINMHNHINFHLMENNGNIEDAWNRLLKVETAIGKSLSYAFSQRFGFLSSEPAEAGTGLQVTIYLQLPALVHTDTIDEVLDKHADDSVLITGFQGSPTELIGDILMVKNNYSIGVSEEKILSSLHHFTTKMILEENTARSKIRKEENPEMKDRVSRAYGILIHSYQLETIEALNALSLLKLGIDFEWVKGITVSDINTLTFNCRRAHLVNLLNEKIEQESLSHKRAEFVHQALKNVSLVI